MFLSKEKRELFPHDYAMQYTFIPLIPKWILPNHITVLRFLLTPFVATFFILEMYQWGTIFFVFAAFTDALDGSLARVRNQITEWGQAYDPLADKLLVGSVMIILALKYFFFTTIIMVSVDLSFIVAAWWWKSKEFEIKANIWGKIKMLLQVCGILVLLLAIILEIPFLFFLSIWFFYFAILFAIASLITQGI
ncbi:MAG: CDP-diacylglycerol-glycerol-3-phosphate 3-phosphatidyltransferase [Parcubacteria group bacterium GW2011_GWA2_38_13]|nr:MAG: CDP-diacylglycerol-glycerol-3-phosphate 3-phosphatidyltransferase [Parcubacteria group bacterium GW2011_GWA2_38_13]